MKILFMGTPEYSLPSLDALAALGYVAAVFTRADKPRGRGMETVPSPVKARALELGLPVYTPKTLRCDESAELVAEIDPDMIAVVSYGLILPPAVLAYPRFGCINAHGSLLPRWRGAAPIQRAIMAGDDKTGVTSMIMDDGIDTGDIIKKYEYAIAPDDDFGRVYDALAELSAAAFCDAVDAALGCGVNLQGKNGAAEPPAERQARLREIFSAAAQPPDGAVYAAKIDKAECRADFTRGAADVCSLIRALSPAPYAAAAHRGKTLKLASARVCESGRASGAPGTVSVADGRVFVACGPDGGADMTAIELLEVVPEGRRRMSAADFARGRGIADGEVLA